MKCHYCDEDYPMTQLQFVEDGMVPGIAMVRRRARCIKCRIPPNTIDGKPSDPPPDEDAEKYPF